MRILTPGLYQIVPVGNLYGEEDDDGEQEIVGTGFQTDPVTAYVEYEDGLGTALPEGFEPPVGIVESPVGPEGTLLVTLDLGGFPLETFEATSVNSPLGPLSISRSYALMPTENRTTYPNPGEQDAINWIVLDLTAETTISVDGGRLVIGNDVVDVAAGPDFVTWSYSLDGVDIEASGITQANRAAVVTTEHVIRAGSDLHTLFMGMVSGEDDSVLVFIDTDEAGHAAVRAIDDAAARVVARDMVRHDGSFGTVLSFHVTGTPRDDTELPLAA